MPKIKPSHSSRRAPPLKDGDYDHEINLVDHSAPVPTRTLSPESDTLSPTTSAALPAGGSSTAARDPSPTSSHPSRKNINNEGGATDGGPAVIGGPTVAIDEPTPLATQRQKITGQTTKVPLDDSSSAIDILYENQRGGFLCGIALFSSKALGNLDPPAWTNFAHHPSPTDIKTAQVPDPSWEWAWPEWRINRDDGVDEFGWKYSFMFSKKFSWHGPSWWNSFVRRRAWIRKRVKKESVNNPADPHLLNPEYFTVRASSEADRSRSASRAGSHLDSRASTSQAGDTVEVERPDIEDIESLLHVLRTSRIDREKIEAVDNYLEHGEEDLVHLQEEMHEIMSLFVFQASRRILLTRLSEVQEQTLEAKKTDDSSRLERKAENLAAAIKHADEEVRRLEYWSDAKGLDEEGALRDEGDHYQGLESGEDRQRDPDSARRAPSAPPEPRSGEIEGSGPSAPPELGSKDSA